MQSRESDLGGLCCAGRAAAAAAVRGRPRPWPSRSGCPPPARRLLAPPTDRSREGCGRWTGAEMRRPPAGCWGPARPPRPLHSRLGLTTFSGGTATSPLTLKLACAHGQEAQWRPHSTASSSTASSSSSSRTPPTDCPGVPSCMAFAHRPPCVSCLAVYSAPALPYRSSSQPTSSKGSACVSATPPPRVRASGGTSPLSHVLEYRPPALPAVLAYIPGIVHAAACSMAPAPAKFTLITPAPLCWQPRKEAVGHSSCSRVGVCARVCSCVCVRACVRVCVFLLWSWSPVEPRMPVRLLFSLERGKRKRESGRLRPLQRRLRRPPYIHHPEISQPIHRLVAASPCWRHSNIVR